LEGRFDSLKYTTGGNKKTSTKETKGSIVLSDRHNCPPFPELYNF